MSEAMMIALIVATPGFVASLAAVMVAWSGRGKATAAKDHIDKLEIKIDGRMEELLVQTALAARLAGEAVGKRDGEDKAVLVAEQTAIDIRAAEARTPERETE